MDCADLDEVEFEYLYSDVFHFMNTENYEQMTKIPPTRGENGVLPDSQWAEE